MGLAGKHYFCILEVSRETSKFWLCFQKMLNGWGERAQSETEHPKLFFILYQAFPWKYALW